MTQPIFAATALTKTYVSGEVQVHAAARLRLILRRGRRTRWICNRRHLRHDNFPPVSGGDRT